MVGGSAPLAFPEVDVQLEGTFIQKLLFRIERVAVETKKYVRTIHRTIRGRDLCEYCDGTQGEPGNENIIMGRTVCDYCHAKYYRGV